MLKTLFFCLLAKPPLPNGAGPSHPSHLLHDFIYCPSHYPFPFFPPPPPPPPCPRLPDVSSNHGDQSRMLNALLSFVAVSPFASLFPCLSPLPHTNAHGPTHPKLRGFVHPPCKESCKTPRPSKNKKKEKQLKMNRKKKNTRKKKNKKILYSGKDIRSMVGKVDGGEGEHSSSLCESHALCSNRW